MRLRWEIALVLLLSVGRSAIYSVLALIQALQRDVGLGDQSSSLNPSADAASFWEVRYQFLGQAFGLVPVALAIFLLWGPGKSAFRRIGLAAGAEELVTFDAPVDRLAFTGADGTRRVEPGGFRLWVGAACDDEETVATFELV